MSADYQSYLQSVRKRLGKDSFQLQEKVTLGEFNVDMLAFKDETFAPNRTTLCCVTYFPQVDVGTVMNYTRVISEKGFEHQHEIVKTKRWKMPPRSNLYVFPVLVSPKFDDATKEAVESKKGLGIQGIGSHYVVHVEAKHPVLAELQTSSIIHFARLTFVGLTDVWSVRKFAVKHFSFET